jgi:hypothetical protein
MAKHATNLLLNTVMILSSPAWILPYLILQAVTKPARFWEGTASWPIP